MDLKVGDLVKHKNTGNIIWEIIKIDIQNNYSKIDVKCIIKTDTCCGYAEDQISINHYCEGFYPINKDDVQHIKQERPECLLKIDKKLLSGILGIRKSEDILKEWI